MTFILSGRRPDRPSRDIVRSRPRGCAAVPGGMDRFSGTLYNKKEYYGTTSIIEDRE
jgi:hypothetical protein